MIENWPGTRRYVTRVGSLLCTLGRVVTLRFPSHRCFMCGALSWDDYMVKDEVWSKASKTREGFMHLNCLALALDRAGHVLDIEDFTMVPANAGVFMGFLLGVRRPVIP